MPGSTTEWWMHRGRPTGGVVGSLAATALCDLRCGVDARRSGRILRLPKAVEVVDDTDDATWYGERVLAPTSGGEKPRF